PDNVTFAWSTTGLTAISGVDYNSSSGQATFLPADNSKQITASIIDDSTDEPSEQFRFNVTNVDNATIVDGTGVVTILDDDDPPPPPSIA
ncbi:Calx-beta domain-containing protein, partial [Salmonella sp. SAL4436]|uniref:Calx-beta domain-containing protein n=1 Tax=Salmonella sp. SAL4436 TaxID=3159891 RepID=UPI003979FC73